MTRAALAAYAVLDAEVVVPLRFQDELARRSCCWAPKRSEAAYTDEDLALLETVADQAAVAVANAEAHRRVLDYARELERSLMIRTNLAKFVPQRVRELIEESPEAPSLDKRETDVTVLFADITGYTRLTTRLAPDALDALVERYFGAFLDEIVQHGGDVNETAGDGLMVIFHEGDHARAAVEAARGIHRRAAEIDAELRRGASSRSRCTSASIPAPRCSAPPRSKGARARAGPIPPPGSPPISPRASPPQAAAGEVVLSESTLARLPDGLPVDDLGTREVKNVDGPVRLFRLR